MIEFIKSVAELLNRAKVEYLIVGGAAKMLHKQIWKPSDLDILVYNNRKNLNKFNKVLNNNKMILELKKEKIVRVVGQPYSIDIHKA